MADYRAIEAVGQALIYVLRANYRPEDFDNELQFQVYLRENFADPMTAGVSLFLYRLIHNGIHRIPSGRRVPGEPPFQTKLPLDLHYMVTVWARDASLQHRIAGWMMRTIEDTPVIPFAVLDAVATGVFSPEETVELVLGELSTEDLLRIWETLGQDGYQLSIPYLARNIYVESSQRVSVHEPVQERRFGWQTHDAGAGS